MSAAGRPVDTAMNADRPEKKAVRDLWVTKVQEHDARLKGTASADRLYLTLCGAAAKDIKLLIDGGVLSVTETGSLAPESAARIAAIENNPTAVVDLLRTFPGLKVHKGSFEALLHGNKPTRFPSGDSESLCRSAVVNLDLNNCLEAFDVDGDVNFPLINQLDKLATIHCSEQKLEWTLLLTLHGELHWSDAVWNYVASYLLENMESVAEFRTAIEAIWGHGPTVHLNTQDIEALKVNKAVHQRLILSLVPKLVADKVRSQRWAIHIDWSFAYGGAQQAAPMVTWSLDFKHAAAGVTSAVNYKQNVARILANARRIDGHGHFQPFL